MAEVAKIRQTRIQPALKPRSNARDQAGIFAHSTDDAATILRGVLEVTDKGEANEAAPNVVPGNQRNSSSRVNCEPCPHYWPASVALVQGWRIHAHAR